MRLRLRVGLFAMALVVVAALVVPASADLAPKWSDVELAGFSEVILTGTVANIAAARDNTGAIYTYVTIDVGDVLKGWIFERQIVIKQLGGSMGDENLVVYGQPLFALGEETLLFLEVRPRDETLYTAALWQGKWHLEADASGQRIATRQVPGFEDRGVFNSQDVRSLAGFLGQLRAIVGPEALKPGTFLNTHPREMPVGEAAGVNTAPYTFLGPGRWRQIDSGIAIPVNVQTGGQPGLSGGGGGQLVNSATLWMSAGSSFRWVAGNTGAAAGCIGAAPSDRTLITYNDPCAEISNSGGTLAVAGFFAGSVTHTVNGQGFATASSGFLVFNDGATTQPFVTNSGCFQDIATHELGHTFGAGHSSDSSAIMFPTVSFASCSKGAHALGADDVALIRFIYPGGGAPPTPTTVPGAPTNLTATVSAGRTVTLTWGASPAVTGAPAEAAVSLPSAATSYRIEAGSASGLSNLAAFSTGSTATTFSTSGVPPGTYYVRVKGQNSAGTGSASNQVVVTVTVIGTP